MHIRFLILSLILGNLITGVCSGQLFDKSTPIIPRDAVSQNMIDFWAKGMETNGLVCAVTPYRANMPTHLLVYVINNSTNGLWGGLRLPPEKLFSIELFNAQGQPVEKTDAGKKFGLPVTDTYLNDWFKTHVNQRGSGLFGLKGLEEQEIQDLSIPQVFQLHQSGEYTLHLRIRLIQYRTDAYGKPYFPVNIWLPEVVANVQIQPEDIPSLNLPPNTQTNSPAK